MLSVAEDITARKQAEATHRAVLRALPDWIFVLSADGVFLDFHAKDPERLAAPPESFLGKRMQEVLPPDIADGLLRCFERAMSSDDTATLEYSLPARAKSASSKRASSAATPTRSSASSATSPSGAAPSCRRASCATSSRTSAA